MRRTVVWQLIGLILAVSASWPAAAGPQIHKGTAADWVEFVPLPSADPALAGQIRNGQSNLLSDFQTRAKPDGYEVFDRYAYKIVDRTGLERGASISVEFDPATQDVTFNELKVIRDGVAIDHLTDITFDVFRREKDAEKGVFDGWLTAYANIDDVRIGDIVDYSKTTVRKPLVGRDLMSRVFDVAWYEPVALIREKIIWPREKPLTIRSTGTDIQPEIQTRDGLTTYLWQAANPKPEKQEDNVPPDASPYQFVSISSTARWQDIADAILPYYRLDQPLPAEFAAKLDAIATSNPLSEDRMIEVMRLVQDSIRYVSLSIGQGSYVPRSPTAVVTSGFGDCKDKALLLATSLRRLGIEAVTALTDFDEGIALQNALPSLRAFDHVIVKASIGERVYWLDATNYLQGGEAENLVAPGYYYALPILPVGTGIEKIEQGILIQPTTFVSELFLFPKLPDQPLRLKVETIYHDADADKMRYKLISQSRTKIADDYLQYYNRQYPGMKAVEPLVTKDDRDGNIIVINESYELVPDDLHKNGLAENFPLKADIGLGFLPEPSSVGRQSPVWLGLKRFNRHKITVKNLKARFAPPEDIHDIITPYMAFSLSWSSTPTEFELDWILNTLNDRAPIADLSAYLKALKDISYNASLSYNFAYAEAEAN